MSSSSANHSSTIDWPTPAPAYQPVGSAAWTLKVSAPRAKARAEAARMLFLVMGESPVDHVGQPPDDQCGVLAHDSNGCLRNPLFHPPRCPCDDWIDSPEGALALLLKA